VLGPVIGKHSLTEIGAAVKAICASSWLESMGKRLGGATPPAAAARRFSAPVSGTVSGREA
jgi:hypothetical protein